MSKSTAVLVVALLLFASLAHAARPGPAGRDKLEDLEVANLEKVEEGCEGVGEEECLARRTLSAHVDYIYTQGGKH